MKLIKYEIISKANTSSTTTANCGSVFGNITVEITKKRLFRKYIVTIETLDIVIKYMNQYFFPARRLDNGLCVHNDKFSEHITDVFNHELKKKDAQSKA